MNTLSLIPDVGVKHIPERYFGSFVKAVNDLDAAVATGVVPNATFTLAKYWINRAVEESAKAFLDSGPRRADGHAQSAWWHDAYRFSAFVYNAHGIPAALKKLKKAINTDVSAYTAFLQALLPLRDLLEAAKPLVAKRGDPRLPVVKSARQIADEANQMTCQCCGRGIFAATGVIAHHGYERPGTGWQTASCIGARELPFEVSRERLGDMINSLTSQLAQMKQTLEDIKNEHVSCTLSWSVWDRQKGRHVSHSKPVTRATFPGVRAELGSQYGIPESFDRLLTITVVNAEGDIRGLTGFIKEQQARYDGWKQTHRWAGEKWETI